jgi:hypothetical protein
MLSMFGKLGSIIAGVAQAVQPTQESIQQELQAYQRDKNPDHLFRVIALQQAIIEHRTMTLGLTSQLGSIMEGALKGLDPNTPGPKISGDVMRAIENMLGQVSTPAPFAGLASPNVAGQMQAQQAMQKQQEMLQQITRMLQQRSEMTKSIIQNMR